MIKPISSLLVLAVQFCFAQTLTLESIKSYPFPSELSAAATGSRIAWAVDEQGKRNVYVAEGPEFKARRVTNFMKDDGQEITSLSLSDDGKWVVFVRGGDHGSNWDDELPVNPTFAATPLKVKVMSVSFDGGDVKTLSEGDAPTISPKGNVVAFIKGGQAWTVAVDGSAEAKNLFTTRGTVGSLQWSPDGSSLAFVSSRGDHSLVGVFTNADSPIQWIAPSFSRDGFPSWSPDGTHIAFARTPGGGGEPDSILMRKHQPWSIWSGDVKTATAMQLWKAPKTLTGSFPTTHGQVNLNWAAEGRITFLSYHDGWPHLYSISEKGGDPILLTPGKFMVEYVKLSPDKKTLVFCANHGVDPLDMDRRHVISVPVTKASMELTTAGSGLEWAPVVTGNNQVVCISATAQRPPLPALKSSSGLKLIGEDLMPKDYPSKYLVTPKQVTFKSPDGFTIHGQLFEPAGGAGKKPAIIYVHGGPPRQMLLGWHYSDYYSNAYASNQYLTSLGFVVLVVNYRLGIGYGYEFHQPDKAGTAGASEYFDIKAAGEWLASQPNVDASRIGIYGGSYGGYLVAMALGKDSKIFAAGVDIHGVHDRTIERTRSIVAPDKYERAPDADQAAKVAWESSPTAFMTGPLNARAVSLRLINMSVHRTRIRRLKLRGNLRLLPMCQPGRRPCLSFTVMMTGT